MAGKREKPEEIVSKLRQVEVLQGQGTTVAEAVRQIGVTQQTFYRWRKLYGGMQRSQLTRLKELEKENQRLRRAVSDLTLDKMILTEADSPCFAEARSCSDACSGNSTENPTLWGHHFTHLPRPSDAPLCRLISPAPS